ncbi:uncharacterized protein [Prorops nasuta]|uniref:uncharacterized protein n=1 Tax=Prorops nasuta TaxID=863751 RepID=UPI0034CF0F2B
MDQPVILPEVIQVDGKGEYIQIPSHVAVSSYGHPIVVNQAYGSYGNAAQDLSATGTSYGGYAVHGGYGGATDVHSRQDEGGYQEEQVQHHYGQTVPISEHVEVTKPIPVPVVKNIGIPVAAPVAIPVPHPIAIGVPQPYPVHVPVAKPVAIPVVKTIAVPVEKKVPYAVEKIIPVPVEKPVPIPVEKNIPVPVDKPYPIHIPVYKHVFYRVKHHPHPPPHESHQFHEHHEHHEHYGHHGGHYEYPIYNHGWSH